VSQGHLLSVDFPILFPESSEDLPQIKRSSHDTRSPLWGWEACRADPAYRWGLRYP
jgi:hypothetical protein